MTKYKSQVVKADRDFPLEYVPFSLLSVNRALGSPGVMRGRVHQVLGKTETGKTSLTCDLIQNAQSLDDKRTLYVDIECRFMPTYAATLGVDLTRLDLAYPDSAEQCMDIILEHIETGNYNIVVLDSVPAIVSDGELEKSFTESENIRANAMILRRFIARVVPLLFRTGTILVLINQLRANQSTLSRAETKPYGPFFMHHACTTTIELTYMGKKEDAKEIRAHVTKNSQSGIHGMALYTLFHAKGFDVAGDVLTLALEYAIVEETSKGRYKYNDIKAHGRDNALDLFPIAEIKDKLQHLFITGSLHG
jgi:recombination protein RecA